MPSAFVKFHTTQHYQRKAFEAGLERNGFVIDPSPSENPSAGDCIVLWNRYARDEAIARRYEAAQASVLIGENAWLGPEEKEKHHFAICRGHHNGAGSWYVGTYPRPHPKPEPWRTSGEHILVLATALFFGIGTPETKQLRDDTKRRKRPF